MQRRALLKYGLAAGALALTKTPTGLARALDAESTPMIEMTIAQLQTRMDSGALSAHGLSDFYLQRIADLDASGPELNSVIELNPDALAIAQQLDDERRQGHLRGPLHGIPILIKDNIDTADRMQTTAGSLALVGTPPKRDAFLVKRLREAGAVLLGKSNLSEWANFRSTRSTSGWSSRGGQCKNPHVLDRSPCGSSSGSGAAVAADLCAAAIGTETDGSVVCPANANGIVGFKPTLGLLSRTGIVPIAHSQDTAGSMARTVADAAVLLSAMTGADPTDIATRPSEFHDYTRYLDADGLRGARIGIARNFFGFDDRVDRIMEDSIAAIKALGAQIIDPANIETIGLFGDSELTVLLYEFKSGLNAYLTGRGSNLHTNTLQKLIAYNEANADEVMPYFGQEHFIAAQEKGPLTDKTYLDALAQNHRLSRDEGIDATMHTHQLDAIVAPTGGPAWVVDLVNGDHFGGGCSSAAAVAGYPHITVPAGFIHDLPVGISFFSGAWQEPMLVKCAYAFEQATKMRRAAKFLPSIGAKG